METFLLPLLIKEDFLDHEIAYRRYKIITEEIRRRIFNYDHLLFQMSILIS